jgi:hypothetical protein
MIYVMLMNNKDGRYHPVLFRPAIMPGNADANALPDDLKELGDGRLSWRVQLARFKK